MVGGSTTPFVMLPPCKICKKNAVVIDNKEYYCAKCMLEKIKKNEKRLLSFQTKYRVDGN
tara:strand:+ start:1184 stop:1363 length:180 start_codon:yes stop_codon:yes gene_type:complete